MLQSYLKDSLFAKLFCYLICAFLSIHFIGVPAVLVPDFDPVGNAGENDIVVGSTLSLGSKVQIQGKARGYWYFEASFPVEIKDATGNIIASGIATAQSEWMTEEFVPFSANIDLATPYSGPATIILKKDNPSGEADKDASLSYPATL